MNRKRRPSFVRGLIGCGLTLASLFLPVVLARGDDEAVLFTPPGFPQPGKPATATGPESGKVAITVIDAETGKPTPCRVNVVGPDGNFYQPPEDRLSLYSLTGEWPKSGKGNRAGKAPIRYFGRFFYTTGEVDGPGPARARSASRSGRGSSTCPARRPSRSVPARRRRSRSTLRPRGRPGRVRPRLRRPPPPPQARDRGRRRSDLRPARSRGHPLRHAAHVQRAGRSVHGRPREARLPAAPRPRRGVACGRGGRTTSSRARNTAAAPTAT